METIKGIFKNGQIVLDRTANWPEGCRVTVEPEDYGEFQGMTEEEQSNHPEAIPRWIAEFKAIPPWEMTPEEEAEWQAARQDAC